MIGHSLKGEVNAVQNAYLATAGELAPNHHH